MSIRITIDEDLCVGSGDCARIAPDAFEVNEEAGLAVVRSGTSDLPLALLEDAAYQCPTGAITIEQA